MFWEKWNASLTKISNGFGKQSALKIELNKKIIPKNGVLNWYSKMKKY